MDVKLFCIQAIRIVETSTAKNTNLEDVHTLHNNRILKLQLSKDVLHTMYSSMYTHHCVHQMYIVYIMYQLVLSYINGLITVLCLGYISKSAFV